MDNTADRIDLTGFVIDVLELVSTMLVATVLLAVVVYVVLGIPLIVYLSAALERRLRPADQRRVS